MPGENEDTATQENELLEVQQEVEDTTDADAKALFEGNFNPEEEGEKSEKADESSKAEEKKTEEKPSEEKSILDEIGLKKGDEKPEEKKAEEVTEDDIDKLKAPEDDSPNRPGWDELKSIAKAEREQNKAKDARIAELESQQDKNTETLRARNAELEEQNKQFSERLKAIDFKSHPEFYDKFIKPVETIREKMEGITKMEGVEASVESLLALRGKDFAQSVSDVMDELSGFNKTQFADLARQALEISEQRDAASQNMDNAVQDWNQNRNAEVRRIFDATSDNYQKFQPLPIRDGITEDQKAADESYNNAIQATTQKAEEYAFGQMTDERVAEVSNKAAQFDFIVEHAIPRLAQMAASREGALKNQISDMAKELAEFKNIEPGQYTYTPSADASPDESPTKMEEMDNDAAADALFAGTV